MINKTINCLRSKMTGEQALRRLAPGNVRRWTGRRLLGLAEVHIPYRLYEATTTDRHVQTVRCFAIDAASGRLDPYEFAGTILQDLIEVETRNYHPIQVDEGQTRQLAEAIARRSLFRGGFFRLSNPRTSVRLIHEEFYIPYWVAFYGTERMVKLEVINGVRRITEGSKVRRMLQAWLIDDTAGQRQIEVCAAPR